MAIVMAGTLDAVAQEDWIFEKEAFGEGLDENMGAALDCIVRGGNWEDCVPGGAQVMVNEGFLVIWPEAAGIDGTAYEEAYREAAEKMIEAVKSAKKKPWFEVLLQGPRWGVSGADASKYVMTVPGTLH